MILHNCMDISSDKFTRLNTRRLEHGGKKRKKERKKKKKKGILKREIEYLLIAAQNNGIKTHLSWSGNR